MHMIFIDLEKAYDKVPRNGMWWALQKHKVSSKYITLIKDMYDNVVTNVRTSDGDTNDFPINIGLYQGSALSPYLFVFFYLAFYCLFSFFIWFFYRPLFFPYFSLLFCTLF
jgi:hypothetical protein